MLGLEPSAKAGGLGVCDCGRTPLTQEPREPRTDSPDGAAAMPQWVLAGGGEQELISGLELLFWASPAGSRGDKRGRALRRALTRVRVQVEAGHVLSGRQRAGQA